MATKIFVNLPVKDLNRSVEFFKKLNFTFNPQFTDENATMMVVSEDISVMLLVEKFFKTFTPKAISDASRNTEVIVSLSAGSREEVDKLANLALQSGGKPSSPTQEMDGMYIRGFEDPDGHLWEVAYMDMSVMPLM
jgi:predicted lactoylglutathione lyase